MDSGQIYPLELMPLLVTLNISIDLNYSSTNFEQFSAILLSTVYFLHKVSKDSWSTSTHIIFRSILNGLFCFTILKFFEKDFGDIVNQRNKFWITLYSFKIHSQQTFTCCKSTMETLEKGVKNMFEVNVNDDVRVSLFLTSNIYKIFY